MFRPDLRSELVGLVALEVWLGRQVERHQRLCDPRRRHRRLDLHVRLRCPATVHPVRPGLRRLANIDCSGSGGTQSPAVLPTAAPPALPEGTPAPTTSVEALAPWPTPKPDAVLTSTGPPTQPPKATSMGPWLAFGSMAILLLTLGVINLRRRGP